MQTCAASGNPAHSFGPKNGSLPTRKLTSGGFMGCRRSEGQGARGQGARCKEEVEGVKGFCSFEEWMEHVPGSIKRDALWEMMTYRKAWFW